MGRGSGGGGRGGGGLLAAAGWSQADVDTATQGARDFVTGLSADMRAQAIAEQLQRARFGLSLRRENAKVARRAGNRFNQLAGAERALAQAKLKVAAWEQLARDLG